MQHNVTFVEKNSHKILLKIKITETLEIIGILQSKYRGAAHSICNLRFSVPDKIPVIFCNGSNYDYNFIIKELPNECKGKFECPRENTEKFKTFTVPIEKVIKKIDRDDNEGITTVFYKIKFIDSARFMTSSLSNLVDNLAKWIHKIKYKDCNCFCEYEGVNDNLIKYKCLSHNKNCSTKIDEKLKKLFKATFKFSKNDFNKIILLLRKGVYPYEYMDEWEKFNETLFPRKEDFYSNLNMEDIKDSDYNHAKRVCKKFEIKNLGEYHYLCIKSDTLLLANFLKTLEQCV